MENTMEISFQLILNAGNSKSNSLMAIEAAREGDFEEALKLIKEAEKDLTLAHQTQTNMIQNEAKGTHTQLDIILIHAQDHLTTAMIMIDQAREFLEVYRMIKEIKEELNK